MAPQSWANDEQDKLLHSMLPEYLEINAGTKDYGNFWAKVRQVWFQKYSECGALFPGKAESELNEEERSRVTEAMQKTSNRLRSWFRWRANPAANAGRRARTKTSFQGRDTCQLKNYELYSKLYYAERILPRVQKEVGGLDKMPKNERLLYIQRITREAFESESEEIKSAVEAKLEALKSSEPLDDDDTVSPESYQRAIDDIPGYLGRVLSELSDKSGWSFTVLMGGPCPQSDGELVVASLHEGMTPLSFDFGQAYPEFRKNCLVPFTQFLENLYPEDIRRARALTKNGSTKPTSPAKADLEAADQPSTIEPSQNATLLDLPPPSNLDVSPDTSSNPSPPADCNASLHGSDIVQPSAKEDIRPTDSNASVETGLLGGLTAIRDLDFPAPSAVFGSAESDSQFHSNHPFTIPANNNQVDLTSVNGDGNTYCGSEYVNAFPGGSGSFEYAFPANPSGFTDLNFDYVALGENWSGYPSHAGSATVESGMFDWPGTGLNTSPPSETIIPTPGALFPPHLPFGNAIVSPLTPNPTFFTHPLLSNTFHTPTVDVSVVQFPGVRNLCTQVGDAATVVSDISTNLRSNTSHSDASNVDPSVSKPSPPTTMSEVSTNQPSIPCDANQSDSPKVDHSVPTLIDEPQEKTRKGKGRASGVMKESGNLLLSELSSALPQGIRSTTALSSEAETRRSARATVPSKRSEQMNQIGSKNAPVPSVEKENIPPSLLPTWAIAAKKYLLGTDLGVEWAGCVQGWLEVEETLGYGSVSGSKAALPAIASRPEEWSKWVVKTRGGDRPYQDHPTITDAAEFGHAFIKWWNAMQPVFRQAAEGMPLPLYTPPTTDSWASLQRAGPNGMITVVTLLFWWGKALSARSRWQEDSGSSWKEVVNDVTRTLQSLKEATCSRDKKRKATGTGQTGKGKRSRV